MKAFPRMSHTDCYGYKHPAEDGMDLRDYFAAKAMQASLSKNKLLNEKEIADCSYLMADAMMKAREE
jgi:hypothetical protein